MKNNLLKIFSKRKSINPAAPGLSRGILIFLKIYGIQIIFLFKINSII